MGKRLLIISVLQAFIMLTVFTGAYTAAAASEAIDTNDPNKENNRIRITADKLIAEVDAGEIEFVGNVKATQADAVITSDHLKIIYDPDTIKNETRDIKNVTIKKIIANGHVKIVTDNVIADTDRAEYTVKSKVLVLLGEQSKVSQGGHSITGTKFTLYRNEGKLIVESSGEKRIKAILQPGANDKKNPSQK
jgi:lipopolysaccharide export system protein LptA